MTGVRDAHLVVVGRGQGTAAAAAGGGDMKLAGRVHFAGGQEDVKPWYGMADCFVLPTLYDPFPNAALEAMACGLPLDHQLAVRRGRSSIESGVEGYVCRDALDVVELARCLNLAAAPGQARRMGAAARRKVEPFSLDGMAQQLTRLYSDLLQTKSSLGNEGIPPVMLP